MRICNNLLIYAFLLTAISNLGFSQSEKPNVLMIVLDDLNDYIGALEEVPAWKALIGTIWLYDDGSTHSLHSFVNELDVSIEPSVFEVPITDLRTNDKGLPSFSDPLSNTNNLYRTSGNFYFSDILPEDYDGDANRLVRDNSDPQDVELVYNVDDLNYFKIDFWTFKYRSLEEISSITGTIQAYISTNSDNPNDYIEVPLKFVRIKNVGDWILYALVPENEIETVAKFLKISITGGTEGSMWGGQYGSIHLYDSSLATQDNVLSNSEEMLNTSFIHPNPANDILHIEGLINESEILIYNTIGKLVHQTKTDNSINISHLKSALYFLKIENNKYFKFIKQ